MDRRDVRTAPASRMRPKFGKRPSAVARVMKSSDPASIAITVTFPGPSCNGTSTGGSMARASSTSGVPPPRSASGTTTDPTAIATSSAAHTARRSGDR
jgi:hypothetical protein